MKYKDLFLKIFTLVTIFSFKIESEKASLPQDVPFKIAEMAKGEVKLPTLEKNLLKAKSTHKISGQISASKKSTLPSKIAASIKQIVARSGDVVKKGGILAKLDATDFEIQLNMAKAKKEQALAQEKSLKNEFEREKILQSENASSKSQFDQMESNYQQARIAVQLADLQLKTAQINLENTNIRAPYNCMVTKQYQEIGEFVNVGAKIFDVYEVNTSEIDLNVPEILIEKIKVGQKLSISIPSTNYRDEALVSRIVPLVSENTRTFKVIAKFKNQDKKIVPGLFAEAQVALEH